MTSIRTDPASCDRAHLCAGGWHLDPWGNPTEHGTAYGRQSNLWTLLGWGRQGAADDATPETADGATPEAVQPRAHGNILAAPLDGLARLVELAAEVNREMSSSVESVHIRPSAERTAGDAELATEMNQDELEISRDKAEVNLGRSATSSGRATRRLAHCDGDGLGWCPSQRSLPNALRDHVLDTVGCTFALRPGDMLFLDGEIYHRTQDMGAARAALRVQLGRRSPRLFDSEEGAPPGPAGV